MWAMSLFAFNVLSCAPMFAIFHDASSRRPFVDLGTFRLVKCRVIAAFSFVELKVCLSSGLLNGIAMSFPSDF